jgi:DNA-binding transcriptional LysR family regulator
MNLDLRQLNRFLAIVEHGSFSEAAKKLHITQQALSTSIARLEDAVGVSLFDRGRGGQTAPTVYGRTLIKHSRLLLLGEHRAIQELHDLRDASAGEITVGVGEVLAGQVVADAVNKVHSQRPDININLVEGYSDDMNERLLAGEVDFVAGSMRHDTALSNELVHEHLFDLEDIIAVRKQHPLARQHALQLVDLVGYTWIVPRFNPDEHQLICENFIAHDLEPPKSFIRSDTLSVGMSLMISENYLLMTSPVLLGPQFGNCLTFLDIELTTLVRSAGLTYRRHSLLSPAAQTLLQQVRDASNELVSSLAS